MNTRSQIAAGVIGAIAFLFLPAAASAADGVSVATRQVIPPGGQSCPQMMVAGVTPYVYEGSLNSFDITLPNAAYVALAGSAGTQGIPFNYMTRDINPDGSLRIHVDLQPSTDRGSVPVSVTLLSAMPGEPVCLSTITFSVQTGGSNAPVPVTPVTPTPTAGGTSGGGMNVPATETPSKATSSATTSKPTTTSPVVGSSLKSLFMNACAKGNGAFELWFVLLALYIVIVAFAALAEVPLMDRHTWLPVGIIVVPLVLLLAFWTFAVNCRTGVWVPLILLIVAVAGLLTALRTVQTVKVIELPPAKND